MKKFYSLLTAFTIVVCFNVLNAKNKIHVPISINSISNSEHLFNLELLKKHDLSIFENTKDQRHKISICHIPPGNPNNAHVITVNLMAMVAHLAHGDSFDLDNCGAYTSKPNTDQDDNPSSETDETDTTTPPTTDCGLCDR